MEDHKRIIKFGGISGVVGITIFIGITVILEQFYWQKIPAKTTGEVLRVLGSSSHSQITREDTF